MAWLVPGHASGMPLIAFPSINRSISAMRNVLILLACILATPLLLAADPAPFPGKASDWKGFPRHDFTVDGQTFLVVEPKQAAPGRPWMWRAEFFGHEPQGDLALLEKGWHIVHNASAAGHYGSPSGVAAWDACYRVLTATHGLSPKPVLEGFSRGGMLSLNWAVAHPTQTSGLYLDAPVCDIRSWPGGKGKGKGSPGDWKNCLKRYDLTEDTAKTYDQGALDRLAPLAGAKVPILLICGDADQVVPWPENGQILKTRYEALGGKVELILKPGVDHHPHSIKDPAPIVAFALGAFTITP